MLCGHVKPLQFLVIVVEHLQNANGPPASQNKRVLLFSSGGQPQLSLCDGMISVWMALVRAYICRLERRINRPRVPRIGGIIHA